MVDLCPHRRRCLVVAALLLFGSLAAPAAAQSAYPARPIKLVVPYPPGALGWPPSLCELNGAVPCPVPSSTSTRTA